VAEDRKSNGEVCGGNYDPRNPACESTLKVSQNPPRTETAKAPPVQPRASTASRPSRADTKYEELLAQAREIMADPEFMEEVMALARLQCQIEKELKKLLGHSALSSAVSEMLVLGLEGGRKRG